MSRQRSPEEAHVQQSICLDVALLAQMRREAERLDRSLSWIVQRCVRQHMGRIRELPAPHSTDAREAAE